MELARRDPPWPSVDARFTRTAVGAGTDARPLPAPYVAGMTPTVVIGYDGSDGAKAALQYGAGRVADGGRMFVVCVTEAPAGFLGTPYYQRVLDVVNERGHELEAEVAGQIAPGVDFETEMLAGNPAEAIAGVARTRDADEIIVGSRGFGRVRAALGSVSHDLLHLAGRPVVVMPTNGQH